VLFFYFFLVVSAGSFMAFHAFPQRFLGVSHACHVDSGSVFSKAASFAPVFSVFGDLSPKHQLAGDA